MSKEIHSETFECVLKMFQDDLVTSQSWSGYKSFKYTFKGDFKQFKEYISKMINLIKNDKGLNKINLENEYVFDEYTPVIVNNVYNKELLELSQDYYRNNISKGVFPLGDRQSNRYKAHNEPFSRFLHYETLPLIEKITGKKLKPTYTYLSSYTKDSDLPPHTDREDCEFTVSLLINKDKDWPIYAHKIKQPKKYNGRYRDFVPDKSEFLELECDVGGLIIFEGTDHIHYRETYKGYFYDVLLLHYRTDVE